MIQSVQQGRKHELIESQKSPGDQLRKEERRMVW